jgi:ketosteroid isomerase-like protein
MQEHAEELTQQEKDNLEIVKRYEHLYNSDYKAFVYESYTEDCDVNGGYINGYDAFMEVEEAVHAAAPRRRMRVERVHSAGNIATVEAVLLDPDQGDDWQLPFVAVMTFRDGKICDDWTYADFTRWPGLPGSSPGWKP